MIFDTTYTNRETIRKINLAVGKPFTWKDRWKMRGIGSKRMTISKISDEYKQYMNADHYISTANIELRPDGIILHFRHKLQAYSWIMPYHSLSVEYQDSLRLASQGKFIRFDAPGNHQFILRMIELTKAFNQTVSPS